MLMQLESARADRQKTLQHRRSALAGAAAMIVITGLIVHFAALGTVGDLVADALYAIMVFLLLSIVFVRQSGWQVAVAAIVFCAGVELLQLTSLPSTLGDQFPPIRLVLGTTFSALDIVAYVLGVVTATVVTTWRRLD